jgi:ABC-2 type transport system permease protein
MSIKASTVFGRFVARRSLKLAIIWGGVFGLLVASSALAYATAYTTDASRAKIASTFGNNIGLKVLLGAPHNLATTAGFTGWRSLGTIIIFGSIWGILTASKAFRGEEAAGRWESFLSGQTTMRRATAQVLGGLFSSVAVMYVIVALATIGLGTLHNIQFTISASLFFAVAAICSAAEFLAVGALASQLMPTRAKAATMTAMTFGLAFVLRAIGNVSAEFHWLVNVSPLGWVENLRPLAGSRPLWLVPIIVFIIAISSLAIFVAGKRDHGESIVADKDTATPKTGSLNHLLPFAWRLIRPTTLAWCAGLLILSTAFSSLAKTAGQAFDASPGIDQALSRISQQASTTGAKTFLSIVFLMLMTIIMLVVANGVSAMREEEADSYLDNLLVAPVGRLRWLSGRIVLMAVTITAMGLIVAVGSYIGTRNVHIAAHDLLLAGINVMAPAAFILGIGILIMGFKPRLTSPLLHALVAWSFIIQIIGSAGNINHYILDTSILHHIALAPVVSPNWRVVLTLVGLGVVGCIVGMLRFKARDLESE